VESLVEPFVLPMIDPKGAVVGMVREAADDERAKDVVGAFAPV